MKTIYLSTLVGVLLFATVTQSLAQKEIYTHPDFDRLAKDHKVIAIIPFKAVVKLRPKQMEQMTEEQFNKLQEDEGLAVQNALHTYFLKRKEQGKTSSEVSLQTMGDTNALLKQAGVTYENYNTYTTMQLCEILGVDAVLNGTLHTSKPMSDGASLAMGLLIGFYGSTNSGNITIHLNDGKTGELLWKYDKTLSRSLGSDTNTVIRTLMRKASKKFPYKDI